MAHTILALDLGSTMGWCIIRNGIIEASGSVELSKPGAHPGHKFTLFGNWLLDFRKVDEIFYEDVPRFKGTAWPKIYCGLLAKLQEFTLSFGIRLTSCTPSHWKSVFTGKGTADKFEVCEACHNIGWQGGQFGTDQDHNEADAIALAGAILHERGVEIVFADSPDRMPLVPVASPRFI